MNEPDVSKIIEVLDRDNALELVNEPRIDEDQFDVGEVSWGSLFPRKPHGENVEAWNEDGYLGDNLELLDEFRDKIANPEHNPENFEPITTGGKGSHWDIAAWYQPIHYYGHDWGIYIKEEYLIQQAIKIAAFLTPSAKMGHAFRGRNLINDLIRASFSCYFLHEHYHHKTESLGLRLHVSHKTSRYLPYKENVYWKTYLSDDCIEEALANADAYHRLRDNPYFKSLGEDLTKATRAYLEADFTHCPLGYRKAIDYLNIADFKDGQNKLCAQMLDGVYPAKSDPDDWALVNNMTRSLFNIRANIYTIVPKGARPILPAKVSPLTCTAKRMQRIAEDRGYKAKKKRGKGSHIWMEKPNSKPFPIPTGKKDLAIGTRKNIMRILGLKDSDLSKN